MYEFLKLWIMILCGSFTYKRLLCLKSLKVSEYIRIVAGSFLISVTVYFVEKYLEIETIPMLVILSMMLFYIVFKTNSKQLVSTTVIAYGICYGVFAFSVVLCSVIYVLLGYHSEVKSGIFRILPSFVLAILLVCLFRIKRLRRGMPFLRDNSANDIGVFTCAVLLCGVMIFGQNDYNLIFTIPLLVIFMCAILVYLWWRARIRRKYIDTLKANEIEDLKSKIAGFNCRINELTKENEELSKIIHKDNKLIPAMELSVKSFLQSTGNPEKLKSTGDDLLRRLTAMAGERKGILHDYESKNKKIVLTGVSSVDSVLNYMQQKAASKGVNLETAINGSIEGFIGKAVDDEDINTALADLIENAVIACGSSPRKNLLVSIGSIDNQYFLSVFDSGIAFDIDTFSRFGLARVTTHADSGGSGIGMKTLFEIAHKYSASVIIKELPCDSGIYAKEVTLMFDGKSRFVIKSHRKDEITMICKRQDLLVVGAGD